jgi:hypothetical protein
VLICFRADWDTPCLLDNALRTCSSQAEKSTIFDFVYAYMRLDEYGASAWRKVKQLVRARLRMAMDGKCGAEASFPC